MSHIILTWSLYFKGNPLFPDSGLDEQDDRCRHAQSNGITEGFKVFFQLLIDTKRYSNL